MTKLAKKLNQLLHQELVKNILPIEVEDGIMVGNVLIEIDGPLKHLRRANRPCFLNIYLNATAIYLAEQLARKGCAGARELEIYQADQDYGRWFDNGQLLFALHKKSVAAKNWDKTDILQARLSENRYRQQLAKHRVNNLLRDK